MLGSMVLPDLAVRSENMIEQSSKISITCSETDTSEYPHALLVPQGQQSPGGGQCGYSRARKHPRIAEDTVKTADNGYFADLPDCVSILIRYRIQSVDIILSLLVVPERYGIFVSV